jgi:RNA polymerase sigma factor (TIGR02999 family)
MFITMKNDMKATIPSVRGESVPQHSIYPFNFFVAIGWTQDYCQGMSLPPVQISAQPEPVDLGISSKSTTADNDALRLIYGELRRLAAQKMAHEAPGHTLQPTALVHEAWLRLGADAQPIWQNRAHFFAAAAEAMRRILVERARRKYREKRGAGAEHVPLEDLEIAAPSGNDEEALAVNDALDRLAAQDLRKAEVVKLRYFVGFSFEQVAEALEISIPTAKREWAYARAWLHEEIAGPPSPPSKK